MSVEANAPLQSFHRLYSLPPRVFPGYAKGMKKTLFCLFFAPLVVWADDDTFAERFADPETREAALTELIPGTRDAFFHTALAHQLAGREEAFRRTMADWKSAIADRKIRVSPEGFDVLENRQLLLGYQRDPQASLTELIRRLGLRFDDSRPDAAAEAATLPTRLDPALITEEAFEKAAVKANPRSPYEGYSEQRRLRELDRVESFDDAKIRWFLDRLDRADLPGVVPLIDRSLSIEDPVAFGARPLHAKLTAKQMESLLALHPSLRSNEAFATTYLTKLLPGAETDFERDLAAHADHLRRCRDFAVTLAPALTPLKAHVLFHHLRLQRELGNHPKDDFIAYLALPRRGHYLLKIPETVPADVVDTERDYSKSTGCPPIGEDVPLIGHYLTHFLFATDDAREFRPFIEEGELNQFHARARLLGGADPARWGRLLDPEAYRELQQSAEISFAPGAPRLLDADVPVSLALDLKNTPELLVRIYQIDLPAHLSRHRSEPGVNIDVDGLAPHHERRMEFPQPPLVRHRETVALPELDGAGVWLVELVSGQVSARALIRKGTLTPFVERAAAGQFVRVFDEKGRAVKDFAVTLGRETFRPDVEGRAAIPDTPNQPVTSGLVTSGRLAAPLTVRPRSEKPELAARFHLDREQLLADHQTSLQLRLRLSSHGVELPLDRIRDAALVLKASLLDGVTVERVIAEGLALKPFMEIPFQVPSDLLTLTFTLRGTVTPATGGEPVKLSQHAEYRINSDLKLARVGTAFFTPVLGGHRLEVRGRNGEPLPSRPLTITCTRYDYDPEITIQVRTDDKGRVDLGPLDAIDYLEVTGTDIADTLYEPSPRVLGYASQLHVSAGRDIRIPLEKPAKTPSRIELSLLESIHGQPARDHFDKLSIDNGDLVIRGLPVGNHQLVQGDSTTEIRVSPSAETAGLLVSPTRILPAHLPVMPAIAAAETAGKELVIRLRNHGPQTRVSLIGRRYQYDEWSPGSALYPFAPILPDSLDTGFHGCGYLTDKRLSDEVRYILDRRAAKTFAGSMLPRPGLLLHRWSEDDLEQTDLTGLDGEAGAKVGEAMRKASAGGAPKRERREDGSTEFATVCDFIASPAVTRIDLTPDADGSLRVPLADFAACQLVEVIAADQFADDSVIVPLPANETPLRDRRLARAFDPKVPYQANRSAAVLAKGATASIENLLDADWRAFTTLAEAHQFLYGMMPDDRLREFVFITEWPDLDEQRKLEFLAKHACHELHLFLSRKDAAFFAKHVKPMLAAKREPTFIDDLLLGRDLKTYLRPYAWQRLNAAEKALLSQALPDARKTIARELSLRWELEAPSPDMETALFTQTLRGTDLALTDSLGLARRDLMSGDELAGVSYLDEKLLRIVIPRIDFEDVSLGEAVDFLRLRAKELDMIELDPGKKGVNFDIRPQLASFRIPELRLNNVPLKVALRYLCDATKCRFKVDDRGITIVPITETGEDIFTRTFQVPPDFAESLQGGGGGGEVDPFAESSAPRVVKPRKPITELLKNAGIVFPEGSSAVLTANGMLLVTNSASELDKIEQLTATFASSEPAAGLDAAAPGFESRLMLNEYEPPELPNSVGGGMDMVDPFAAPASGGVALLARKAALPVPRLFPERTRLWRESDYCRHAGRTDESLIPLNRFWLDLAAWDGKGAFLSPHFNACHSTANEALMCLALLDLPFKAERPEVAVDGTALRVKAREPMLLFYKDTRRAEVVAENSPLLLRQAFSPLGEKFRTVNGREVDNLVTGDFRPGTAYTMSLVVTNPTGTGRRIDVLAQIPAGAIPLEGKPATLASTVEVERHGVLKLEQAFYFPAAGEFAVYPLVVSEAGVVIGRTDPRVLRATNDPAPVDAASWSVVAAEGKSDEVLNRLRTENLGAIDLSAIRWRLRDKAFYQKATAILRERLRLPVQVTSFGFLHNDPALIREYLENSDAVHQLGQWLDSPLLEVRPRVHHDWRTLEFDPLVNPRAHRFTGASRLTHEQAREHYHAFLAQLAWKPALDAADQLSLTAWLLLQDRVEEAIARFARVDAAKLADRMHHDYIKAVLLFHQQRCDEAKTLAEKWPGKLPPGPWRDRFQAVLDQSAEVLALQQNGDPARADAEKPTPLLDLSLTGDGRLRVNHRAIAKAELRLFSVDLEMLFSNNPFLRDDQGGAEPSIRPNQTLDLTLPENVSETIVDLPETMRRGSVLASASAGDVKALQVLDSRAIEIRHQPLDRAVRILDAASAKPLPGTYIKVYAETRDGEIRFHKDGYTDPRGSFDYLSHTGFDVSTVRRVALLASHPEKGVRTIILDR
jgi:hypothetical protein